MPRLPSMPALGDYSGSLLVFVAFFTLTYLALQRRRAGPKRRLPLPPALPAVPILGSMPFIPEIQQLLGFFEKTTEKLGPVFSFYMGSEYTVVLNGRETIHEALVKRSTEFAGRRVSYTVVNYFNVKLLGIIEKPYGASFRQYHQLTLSILKEFGFGHSLMEQRILIEAEELVRLIEAQQGRPFDPNIVLNMCTLNVVASIAFGERREQTDDKLSEVAHSLHAYINSEKRHVDFSPIRRFLPRYKAILEETGRLRRFQNQYIEGEIVKSLASDEDSFVKRFIERQGPGYDKEELVQVLHDLLIAGSETSATSLQWALVILANQRDIQAKLRKEIETVIPAERYPSLDDAAKLPYVQAAILELMRLKTVLPLSITHSTTADTEVGGYFIPANVKVIVNLYSAHMNPADWPEPRIYRPERFLNEAGKVVGKERVIPFSLGKRSCLGELLARQELFLLLTTLIQKFDILPPEGVDKIECTETFVVTLCPSDFEVRLISRAAKT